MNTQRKWLLAGGLALAAAGAFALRRASGAPFPSDHTPPGAYLRIARSMGTGDFPGIFPYLDDDAQWASHSICDARRAAAVRIQKSYPADKRAVALEPNAQLANCKDGPDAFLTLAKSRGWIARLRRDLSGVAGTEIQDGRASLVTARGTRYPFRVRQNGIWGITLFTAELVAERDKATRDLSLVSSTADDYDMAAAHPPPSAAPSAVTGASGPKGASTDR